MKKEDAIAVSHLIDSMQDAVDNLENAHKKGDKDGFERAKKEILDIRRRVESLLR